MWDLIPYPPDVTPIGCKWACIVEHKVDVSLDRYKAHLVTSRNIEEYGLDYDETFAPVN